MKTLLAAALVSLTVVLPALAAPKGPPDHLTMGCEFYNHGQYEKALAYLQDTVSKKPKSWQGHYYLGHTYMALGQYNEAYEQYASTRACRPPAQIESACYKVLSELSQSSRSHAQMAAEAQKPKKWEPNMHEEQLMKDRQQILNHADNEIARRLEQHHYEIGTMTNSAGNNGLRNNGFNNATQMDHNYADSLDKRAFKAADDFKVSAQRQAHALGGH